ncbi:Hydroxyacid-oxoacid transhydrogenase, mitochondrial, partial [Rhizopus stolonifer]
MAAAASRSNVTRLLKIIQSGANSCPCHSHAHSAPATAGAFSSLLKYGRNYASAAETTDYAFEMAASNIRFGPGVTSEVGMDLNNIQAKKVAVYTDST